jgi:hypothetical protein
MKKTSCLIAVLLLFMAFTKVHAQGGFSEVIKVSPSDATKLISASGPTLPNQKAYYISNLNLVLQMLLHRYLINHLM